MPKTYFVPDQIAGAPHTEKSTHMLVFCYHDCAGGAPIVDAVNDPKIPTHGLWICPTGYGVVVANAHYNLLHVT